MPSHIMVVLALCPPVLKQINRVLREFLWYDRKEMRNGHGPVHWQRVCRPLELGGLGIPDLHRQGVALRARWLWLQRTDPSKPWVHLHLPSDANTTAIFRASTSWSVGDGRSCLFWMDHWLDGKSIADLAPSLLTLVPRRRRKSCTVAEGLANRCWVADLRGALTPRALVEYVHLWRLLRPITLSTDPDRLSWRWTTDGNYSAKSCYRALFAGSTAAPFWRITWRCWAPLRVKIFTWLADLDRCWTAARLAHHGLPHNDRCALCDQSEETMQHILIGCPFSRQVWHDVLAWVRATIHAPSGGEEFLPWCTTAITNSPTCQIGRAHV